MAVKRSRSASRMLSVFEAIAAAQPVGVSALSRSLDADKSAVQRDLMTLADAGWIRAAPGIAGQWELTPHILTLARAPYSADSLRQRARPVLEWLRGETGETVYLTVPDGNRFVVIDALESFHMLRMVPPVGLVIPVHGSATARAILPYLDGDDQARMLGAEPDNTLQQEFAATCALGYAVNQEEIIRGAIALASAILDREGKPVGTLVLTGPADRLAAPRQHEFGQKLRAAAAQLSAL